MIKRCSGEKSNVKMFLKLKSANHSTNVVKTIKGKKKITGQYHRYSLADFRQLQENRTSEAGYVFRKLLTCVSYLVHRNIIPLVQSLQDCTRGRSFLGVLGD